MEEVWNKFLISPLEMARYVDEFASPWVKAYSRRGQHAVLRLPAGLDAHARAAHRRVHVKDFKLDRRNAKYAWKNLGEGDVDWPEVRKALADVEVRRLGDDGDRRRRRRRT